ncbi:hypothetical protein HD598_001634 [Neomicrococcus aestuarii]|uniref:Uncharacterized protein n=1 Tax=Neomicrococcus aestuarii TaxID=556325 RepID=A0A7W8X074_9MICC|nr:hypothetical protein [Neomicrococcus aestuarii]
MLGPKKVDIVSKGVDLVDRLDRMPSFSLVRVEKTNVLLRSIEVETSDWAPVVVIEKNRKV